MDRRAPLLLTPIILLILVTSAPAVVGQTATVTPTPTPTVTATPTPAPSPTPAPLPTGQDLLDRSADADAARGTVHLEVRTVRLKPGKERTVERQHGDVDRVHDRYRYVVTGRVTRLDAHPPTTTTYRFEDVEVGKKAALWLPGAGWGCGTVQTVTVTVTPPANPPVPVTVGAETIDGIPVWQVRTPIDDTNGKNVISGTLDDYISRVDFTKVRSTQSTTTSAPGHVTERDTSTTDYTRYGKPVHIQLPAVCRGGVHARMDRTAGSFVPSDGWKMDRT